MIDKFKHYDNAYKFCNLLHVDIIKEEIEKELKGYTLERGEFKGGAWSFDFKKDDDNFVYLIISLFDISLLKSSTNYAKSIRIDSEMNLVQKAVETRKGGLIYSIVNKRFIPFDKSKKQIVLSDLEEKRYVFTNENIDSFIDNLYLFSRKPMHFLSKIRLLEHRINIEEKCNYHSHFLTKTNYSNNRSFFNRIKKYFPTATFLNGENVSSLYNIQGLDKLYRIYDLYNGIINSRNENDLDSIHSGILSKESFDLKKLKGIDKKEESLIGESQDIVSQDYLLYLKNLLFNKFGYHGDLSLDRESILTGIMYEMTPHEQKIRDIEKRLGIPYGEFEKLDFDSQCRLIEEKTGINPLKYLNNRYMKMQGDLDKIILKKYNKMLGNINREK